MCNLEVLILLPGSVFYFDNNGSFSVNQPGPIHPKSRKYFCKKYKIFADFCIQRFLLKHDHLPQIMAAQDDFYVSFLFFWQNFCTCSFSAQAIMCHFLLINRSRIQRRPLSAFSAFPVPPKPPKPDPVRSAGLPRSSHRLSGLRRAGGASWENLAAPPIII